MCVCVCGVCVWCVCVHIDRFVRGITIRTISYSILNGHIQGSLLEIIQSITVGTKHNEDLDSRLIAILCGKALLWTHNTAVMCSDRVIKSLVASSLQ